MASLLKLNGPFHVKRIAIIGAGPAGLGAAKFLLAENAFEKIDIIEQQSEVGGVWNYTPNTVGAVPIPQTTPHVPPAKPIWPKGATAPLFSNPMYDRLNTNIPKGLMEFSDLEFSADSLLFPTREDIQTYLVRYSQDIRHLIHFSTQVEEVSLSSVAGQPSWNITTKSTITEEKSQVQYDAVVVANGHYSVPFVPAVPGIEEFNKAYPNVISHSKVYRSPNGFANKKVIVVGNAPSGLDIGNQISVVSKKPVINSVREPVQVDLGKENKEEVPAIAEYLIDQRGVRFEDGRVETDIDAIVYCTGYLYSYPFFENLDPPIVTTGRRTIGIYQHIFNISHPTLAFMALPQKIIPFPVAEVQSAAIAKIWSNKLSLPEKQEMEAWEKKRVKETGDSTSFHVLGYPVDAAYINSLSDWVRTAKDGFAKEPAHWDEKKCRLRDESVSIRKKFIETGCQAKTIDELGFDSSKYLNRSTAQRIEHELASR